MSRRRIALRSGSTGVCYAPSTSTTAPTIAILSLEYDEGTRTSFDRSSSQESPSLSCKQCIVSFSDDIGRTVLANPDLVSSICIDIESIANTAELFLWTWIVRIAQFKAAS